MLEKEPKTGFMTRVINALVGKGENDSVQRADEIKPSQVDQGKESLNALKVVRSKIKNHKVIAKTSGIIAITIKILNKLERNPEMLDQSQRLFAYILPTTQKLLDEYQYMEEQGVEGANIVGAMRKIEDKLELLIPAYEQQLDQLFSQTTLDLETDIEVMEKVLKTEGLIQDGFSMKVSEHVEEVVKGDEVEHSVSLPNKKQLVDSIETPENIPPERKISEVDVEKLAENKPTPTATIPVTTPVKKAEMYKLPVILSSEYNFVYYRGKYYTHYALFLKNPNEDVAIHHSNVQITVRASDGRVLYTNKKLFSLLYPGQTDLECGKMITTDELPETVEFTVLPLRSPEDRFKKPSELKATTYQPITVENGYLSDRKFHGEVVNPNEYEIKFFTVYFLFRDENKKFIGTCDKFTGPLPAKGEGTVPFWTFMSEEIMTEHLEIYTSISWKYLVK